MNECQVCGRLTYNTYICCKCEEKHNMTEEQILESLKEKGYIE